ncbi:hypothetical protein ACS0TY_017844 [Phlomoides rotata]
MLPVEERRKSGVESPDVEELSSSSASDSNDSFERTGSVLSAIAHLINATIGSGVLSLAWCVAQLGWIAGPLCIVAFGAVTLISSNLLCDCYKYPHPETGHIRNRSYAKAVKSYLGKKKANFIGVFIYESFYGFDIAFTITAAISMRAIMQSNCYHKNGHDAPCEYGNTNFMLVYGAVQLFLAQIPDLQETYILSIIAAAMSFGYASIGLGLGMAKTIGHAKKGVVKGNLSGIQGVSSTEKAFLVFQAIGDIAFTYSYNIIVLDIQDTLKEPRENIKMKKALRIGVSITTFFFLCCGCFGYAAFGDKAPGNLLTDFAFYEPYWLVDLGNVCIALHLMGGYPMYSQPLFAAVERKVKKMYPDSEFVNKEYTKQVPLVPRIRMNLFRLCFRSAYVVSTTAIAIVFPYFNQVLGVIGALNFWPVMIYFPIQMYLKQNDVKPWTPIWMFLQGVKVVCFICSALALVGSVQGLVKSKLGI